MDPKPAAAREELALFQNLRLQLDVDDRTFYTPRTFASLGYLEQQLVANEALVPDFFREHNPIVRHTVLRRRSTLEGKGLLERVGVTIHPEPDAPATAYPGVGFVGLGLLTNHPFDLAYEAAESFTAALAARTKAAGFMRAMLLQRICSSFASGIATATRMLEGKPVEDEEDAQRVSDAMGVLTAAEAGHLRTIVAELSRPEARDPKLSAIRYFLTEHRTDGRTWLEHGCIVFSQYYDTARWVGEELARALPGEPVGVYAGSGKSGIFRDGEFASVEREEIKKSRRTPRARALTSRRSAP